MIYLLYISWLFITKANNCYDGNFETNPLNECVFNCNEEGDKFISKDEVTWTQILHSCYNVREGYLLGECSSLTDLVWSEGCSCPYCSCATKNAAGTPVLFEQIGDKNCYNCTCDEHAYDNTVEGYVYDCEYVGGASSGYNWNDFICPVKHCKDANDNEIDINDGWWDDSTTNCEKYCYCGAEASETCVTGFTSILTSEVGGLAASFNRSCEHNLVDCLNEPDRWVSERGGSNCYCPKCDCGIYTIDDEWWTSYEIRDEPGQTQCVKCRCIDDGADGYARCGYDDSEVEYATGTGACPPTTYVTCHNERGSADEDPTGSAINITTLNSEESYSASPDSWCTWTLEHEVEKRNGEVTDDDWDWSWGDDDVFCAAFGINDACIYSDHGYSYTDCTGETRSRTSRNYLYCCQGEDNCNNKAIDITECTEKEEFGDFFNIVYDCQIDQYHDMDACSTDQYAEEETTCANVKSLYKKEYECSCKSYAILYDAAPQTWKDWMDKQINGFLSGVGYEWNEPLGCNIKIECDLSTGNVYNFLEKHSSKNLTFNLTLSNPTITINNNNDKAADNKMYFIAAIFATAVAVVIY